MYRSCTYHVLLLHPLFEIKLSELNENSKYKAASDVAYYTLKGKAWSTQQRMMPLMLLSPQCGESVVYQSSGQTESKKGLTMHHVHVCNSQAIRFL